MNVVLTMIGQVVIDHKRNLLHVDTTSQQVGSNQHTRRSRTEFTHNNITLLLLHLAVHGRYGKVSLVHLLGKPVDFPTRVAENDSLSNAQSVVQITKRIQFPLFALNLSTDKRVINSALE